MLRVGPFRLEDGNGNVVTFPLTLSSNIQFPNYSMGGQDWRHA